MKKTLLLSLIITSLISGCHKKGPYNLDILNDLKSCQEADIFEDYNHRTRLFRYEKVWIVEMTYDKVNKNISVNQCIHYEENSFNEEVEEEAKSFLDNYFLITKEKLPNLFPPEKIEANYKNRRKQSLIIKEYLNEENYHYFHYLVNNGFIILNYYQFTSNGSPSAEHLRFVY